MASRKKQTFEQALSRLEEIVNLLERGEATLEESMSLFEEGTKLSAALHEMLQNAEQKVTILTQGENGALQEAPFHAKEDAT